jgi:serine/threonine-protein kinase
VTLSNDDATVLIGPQATPSPTRARSTSAALSGWTSATAARVHSTSSPKAGRFDPGAMLAGRYQIIGLLGKGGMGEVYRANDLTLDQPVALKFLPDAMTTDPAMLGRFHGEVRIARQVSHPNVCRVYDIGEVDGHLFLSMEYVDGEDLGSLLRRIGRLPSDKAIEFSRKICAGLAAAHDKGVLHRDLKPANIMIDSQGRVVIMDFGLAALSDQIQGQEIRAGTPAYMSPEQLAGREVTVRSDIYSLGLVLFEMFTGKRPFESSTLAEFMQKQYDTSSVSMSSFVKDTDPAVENVVLRCLSPDPKVRPQSALSVAAALPGGDPLAAALAAGETPSPEMVAASVEATGMRPMWAAACAAAVVVGLIVVAILGQLVRITSLVPLELPPDALVLKAREYTRAFGYTQKPVDSASGFLYDQDYLRYLESTDKSPNRWARLTTGEPPAIFFWYRQSPRYLEPVGASRGAVSYNDPPQSISGMLSLQLDPRGQLISLSVVPPQVDTSSAPEAPMNWSPLFAAAGLDVTKFTPTSPAWTPLATADARAAWTGVWPEWPNQPLRIEAAAWRGRPVFFEMIGPWSRPERMEAQHTSREEKVMQFLLLFFAVAMLLGAALLARYNLRRGRGDQRGAFRLAAFGLFLEVAIWVLTGHHIPTAGEVNQMFLSIGFALLIATALWVGYMALEPYVRRHWPQAIVSWTRLMAGGVRDPLVGRDVLIGVVFGLLWACFWAGSVLLAMTTSGPSASVLLPALSGARRTIGMALSVIPGALIQLFVSFFFLFLVRLVLRKNWLSAIGYVGLFLAMNIAASATPLVDGPLAVLVGATTYLAVTRFGFITFVTAIYVETLTLLLPVSSDLSTWFAGASIFTILIILGLAGYGMHAALAGRSIIQDELL